MPLRSKGIVQRGCLPTGLCKATREVFRALSGPDLAPSRFFTDCCSLEAIRESSAQEKHFLPLVSCSTNIIGPKLGDKMKKDFFLAAHSAQHWMNLGPRAGG